VTVVFGGRLVLAFVTPQWVAKLADIPIDTFGSRLSRR